MTSLQLLAELRRRDVRLWCEGDRLRFDAPRGALTDELRAAIAARRAELMELLRGGGRASELPPLVPLPSRGELPLSFGQKRLWFLDRLQPGGIAYHVPATVRLEGRLDAAALERAVRATVARHENLRARFPDVNGEPRVALAAADEADFRSVALDALEPASAFDEAVRLAREDSEAPFDLARDSLARFRLYRLAPEDHVLHVCTHHIVSDGWSMGVLFRELSALYRAFSAGEPSPLAPLEVQYADFSAWQQQVLERRGLATDLEYWLDRLAGAPPSGLPTDRPRPRLSSHRGAAEWCPVPADLFARLRTLCQREEATLFQVLLTAFFVLLGRIGRQEDVVVGTPIAGRGRRSLEGLIGFFVNNLVLRADLSDAPPFRALLRRVRAMALEAIAHQDVPFEMLVDELQPERDLGRNPLFQVLFNHFNLSDFQHSFPPLEVTTVDMTLDVSKFDLTLHCFEKGEQLVLKLEYCADLFEAETVQSWGRQYLALLRDVVSDPSRSIAELETLSADERRRVLYEWNETDGSAGVEARGGAERTVVEMFAARREETPQAVALAFERRSWTYAELDERTARLAARLRELGVGPESRVALLFERSAESIAALLAVLRAGGAFVPLDPRHPPERLALQLADSGAQVLLTVGPAAARPPDWSGATVELDAELRFAGDEALAGGRVEPGDVEPEQLAYVIYTSGSTGRPKGVEVEHAQLAHYVRAILPRLDLPRGARFALVPTLAADLGHTVLFGALSSGGALHVLGEERVGDGDAFAAYVEQHAIDCYKIVPSHLAGLLAAAREPGRALPRRLLVLGGEACTWALCDAVRRAAPACRVLNHYGPTETTVGVLTHELGDEDRERFPLAPPLGAPLAGTRAYVVARDGRPLPAGSIGELWIGGAGVGRGYANRPEETAERFRADPFCAPVGGDAGRVYRTGDLVRRTPTGALAFVGRADEQVKVRGFRIEPGEIESALASHPEVVECAVRALADEEGRTRLAAWFVTRDGAPAPEPEELRRHLRARLPEPMLPAVYERVAVLPRTASGKLDRRALPEPSAAGGTERERAGAAGGAGSGEPRTPAERTLARIWAEVLRLERVGVHDDFFALGGESILSIQIVSRANQAGLGLTPRDLFEHPTVSELARAARADVGAGAEQGPVSGPVPLTPIALRFLEPDPPDPQHHNHALLFELRRPVTGDVLRGACAALLAHHDALRLRLARESGAWRQRIAAVEAATPTAAYVEVDLRAVGAGALDTACEAAADELQRSLDLGTGPILRVARFRLPAGRPDRLLVLVHHLAVDAVSWSVLLEDLETACVQLEAGARTRLPAKTSSFLAFAERLTASAIDEAPGAPALLADGEAWTRRLGGAAAAGRLPLARPVAAVEPGAVAVHTAELDETRTRALLQSAPRAWHARVDELLLAALVRAVASWTGAPSVLLDVEGHGREELFEGLDLSRTVGWFTSVYPLVLPAPGAREGPAATVRAVKEALRSAPSRGVSWGVLRHLAAGETARAARAVPAAEIGFNYLGRLDVRGGEAGLLAPVEGPTGLPVSPRNPRPHRLDVTAVVHAGRLRVNWVFDATPEAERTIAALAGRFDAALEELVAGGPTEALALAPSDFPLARLDQGDLDALAARYGERGIEDVYLASPVQQGMLFRTLTDPDSPAYVTQIAFTLEGALDAAELRRSWEAAVQRHGALRTAFVAGGSGELHQVVCRSVRLRWHADDRRSVAGVELTRELEALAAEDRRRGFDVAEPPLMRLRLIRTGEARHRFVWTHHHVLLDGWSLPLLMHEVFRAYFAARHGRALALDPPRPFADYVAWLARRDTAAAAAFWRERLAGWSEPTPLPFRSTATPRSGAAQMSARRAADLSEEETDALRRFARARRLTLNTLVQGAWALLLARYSGERDVVFGVTLSGRPAELPGVEAMIGLFLGTLPLRVDTQDRELVPWLHEVQTRQLELQQHQSSSLTEVKRQSEVGSQRSLFDSFLVFENYPTPRVEREDGFDGELQVGEGGDVSYVDYPLAVVVRPSARLQLELRYDERLFEDGTIERMLAQLRTLLAAMPAHGARRLSELPLLGADEARRQLVDWNATRTRYPAERRVEELFEEVARGAPEAPALAFGDDRPSYAQLDARANRLARELIAAGVSPGDRVAVCLERSADFVVALLGVLKSGAAYVPLDPAYPAARLALMLADAAPRALVTTEALAARLPAPDTEPTPRVALDRDAARIAARSAEPCRAGAGRGAEDVAYVMYTSGSTGRPKGVCVPHRAVVRLVRDTDYVALGPDDAVAQASNVSFDAATFEIWGALLNGGRLVGVPTEVLLSAPRFAERIREEGVGVLFVTTALFNQLAAVSPDVFARLRYLLFGGEAVDPGRVRAVLTGGRPRHLLHVYGPTENTTFSTWFEVSEVPEDASTVPIGRPVANSTCYVLDRDGNPAPVGARGELFLGGDGLATGYLNDPELTRERFVPDPFRGVPGARMYRTGDVVRQRSSGDIEFLGRADQQVKLRGFRIEPAEIEAALRRLPEVREAVVLLREDLPGEKRLAAYVVPAAGEVTREALAAALRVSLPEFMVPGAFELLDALPLTSNGKVDRAALPAPERGAGPAGRRVTPPRTAMERLLVEVCQEVLEVAEVGIDDNFFDLGGHSLLTLQVLARLEERAGVQVDPRELFLQTLGQVAARCEAPAAEGERTAAPQKGLLSALVRRFARPAKREEP